MGAQTGRPWAPQNTSGIPLSYKMRIYLRWHAERRVAPSKTADQSGDFEL